MIEYIHKEVVMSTGVLIVIIAAIIAGLVLIFGLWVWIGYNKFVKLRNDVDESYSTMDVYYKKRYDLIPNLVNTVKGYAKHEKETLENVMAARYNAMNATLSNRAQEENALSSTLKSLFKLTENYPDLKADKNFMSLMNTLQSVEDEIVSARKYYNGCVKMLNTKCETFPSLILAKWFKIKKRPLFEVEDAVERKNVKVEF